MTDESGSAALTQSSVVKNRNVTPDPHQTRVRKLRRKEQV